jgi:hypothetical protein
MQQSAAIMVCTCVYYQHRLPAFCNHTISYGSGAKSEKKMMMDDDG